MTQLWVGSTDIWETEEQLSKYIEQKCNILVKSVWFCRNRGSGQLEGYGFIDFDSTEDAVTVMKMIKDTPIPHSPKNRIRLNWGSAHADADADAVQQANGYQVYVGNIPASVTDDKLLEYFQRYFPEAISARLIYGPNGRSKGFGFVKFNTFQEVKDAISQLNGSSELGRPIRVSEATTNRIRSQEIGQQPTTETLFVRDIDPEVVKESTLRHHFSPYGNVVSVKLVDGHPDWAYVTMDSRMEAESARNALQGSRFGGVTKCDIQFGRAVELDTRHKDVFLTVPVMEKPKRDKQKQLEFFSSEGGLKQVIDLIQRVGEIGREELQRSEMRNRQEVMQELREERLFDWNCELGHATGPVMWYF